jgi:hypothetical protein
LPVICAASDLFAVRVLMVLLTAGVGKIAICGESVGSFSYSQCYSSLRFPDILACSFENNFPASYRAG